MTALSGVPVPAMKNIPSGDIPKDLMPYEDVNDVIMTPVVGSIFKILYERANKCYPLGVSFNE
jgi:hypothetical protein